MSFPGATPARRADLWPQLFSDVNCIALWISSEKILTRLYSVLHWFHKRLEVNIKNSRENLCFQTIIVFSFGSFDNSNKCTVLWKITARLITVSTSVNNEMWVKLSSLTRSESDGKLTEKGQGLGTSGSAMRADASAKSRLARTRALPSRSSATWKARSSESRLALSIPGKPVALTPNESRSPSTLKSTSEVWKPRDASKGMWTVFGNG